MVEVKTMRFSTLLLAFAMLLLSACLIFAQTPAFPPISGTANTTNSFAYDFCNYDLSGTPYMTVSTDANNTILYPPGNNSQGNLANNAVICPGKIYMAFNSSDISYGSSSWSAIADYPLDGGSCVPTRSYPAPWQPNQIDTGKISFNSSLVTQLSGYSQHYVTRGGNNALYNSLSTPYRKNVGYIRYLGPGGSFPADWSCSLRAQACSSSRSRSDVFCNSTAVTTSPSSASYQLDGSSRALIGNYPASSDVPISAKLSLNKCVCLILALNESNNGCDQKVWMPNRASNYFPMQSGYASTQIFVRNPSGYAFVSSATYGPFNLSSGQSAILNATITNDASSILTLNVTGIMQDPSNPPNNMTISMLPNQNTTIPAGTQKTLQFNLTQGTPAYNGTLNFKIFGTSTDRGCNGSKLVFNFSLTNVIITIPGAPAASICTIAPPPTAYFGQGNLTFTASCFTVQGGNQTRVGCPALNWSTSSPNTTLNQTSTPANTWAPAVSASYNNKTIGSGGSIVAAAQPFSCFTLVACAPLSCELFTNWTNNIMQPGNTAMLVGVCTNASNNNQVWCPKLQWNTSLVNASIIPNITAPALVGITYLYTSSSTPVQSGRVWAQSREYCSIVDCNMSNTLPPNITITNSSCKLTCSLIRITPDEELYIGMPNRLQYAACTDLLTNTTGCTRPATWSTNVGNITPSTYPGSGSTTSSITVTNINGNYARFNYSDAFGTPCECNLSFTSARPDYVPEGVRQDPNTPIPVGSSAHIYFRTKNRGAGNATNFTTSSINLPLGGPLFGRSVPPLQAGTSTSEEGPFDYACMAEGIVDYRVTVDSKFNLSESNETNNEFNGTINCGHVLACGDYI